MPSLGEWFYIQEELVVSKQKVEFLEKMLIEERVKTKQLNNAIEKLTEDVE